MSAELKTEITSVRVQHLDPEESVLKAYASVVLNGVIEIRNLKVIEGPRGPFVSMPARRTRTGTYTEIVHPTTPSARAAVEAAVLAAYRGDDGQPPGVVAWVRPPPDGLIGRAVQALPALGATKEVP